MYLSIGLLIDRVGIICHTNVDFAHFADTSDDRFRAFTLSTKVLPLTSTTTMPTTTTTTTTTQTTTTTTKTTPTASTTTTTTPTTTIPATLTTTTTPTTTSASGAQSTDTIDPDEPMKVEFAFVDDFKKLVGNNTNAFADKLRLQLAQVLDISEDRIRDLVVSPGKPLSFKYIRVSQ